MKIFETTSVTLFRYIRCPTDSLTRNVLEFLKQRKGFFFFFCCICVSFWAVTQYFHFEGLSSAYSLSMSKEGDYLHEIAERSRFLEKNIGKYVIEVCDVLDLFVKEYVDMKRNSKRKNPSLDSTLKEHFTAIFWSLKLHLKFHCNATAPSDDTQADEKLKDMARWELVCLTADHMNKDPDEKNVIDPGSKILEIVSRHLRELFNIHAEHS